MSGPHSTIDSPFPDDRRASVIRWFTAQGFTRARFDHGKLRITTGRMDGTIVFKLKERPDHDTFFKETGEGALIVFEVKADGRRVVWEGYCPLLLFGIWGRKLAFKAGARAPFRYRDEGHRLAMAFSAYVQNPGNTNR